MNIQYVAAVELTELAVGWDVVVAIELVVYIYVFVVGELVEFADVASELAELVVVAERVFVVVVELVALVVHVEQAVHFVDLLVELAGVVVEMAELSGAAERVAVVVVMAVVAAVELAGLVELVVPGGVVVVVQLVACILVVDRHVDGDLPVFV